MSAELELGARRDRGGEPLGSSGSGKTVLAKVVVEELVRAGAPALCLDPQGDLCSLALAAEDPGTSRPTASTLSSPPASPSAARSSCSRRPRARAWASAPPPLVALQIGAAPGEIDEDRWPRAAATIAALLGYASDDDDDDGEG